MDRDLLGVATLRFQEGGDPTLNLGKVGVSMGNVQEFWNPTLRIKEALIARHSTDPKRDLGPIHFMLIIIFFKVL